MNFELPSLTSILLYKRDISGPAMSVPSSQTKKQLENDGCAKMGLLLTSIGHMSHKF